MISTRNIQSVYPMELTGATHIAPPSIMGQVIRVRPNIYIFVCELCRSEHRNIDSFLSHSEAHFQTTSTQNATQTNPPTAQMNSDWMPSEQPHTGPRLNGSQSVNETIDISTSPSNDSDDYIEEIFEITDLGFDFAGIRYPAAENLPVSLASTTNGTDDNANEQMGKKKLNCSLCPRKYAQNSSLIRHKTSAHADILAKLGQLKSAYKCLVCHKKFPKLTHSKSEAERHLKVHFKKGTKK